ncbi:3-oxoacyl-acyl-carrier-protein reductase, partial [Aphelenchoides avenae]
STNGIGQATAFRFGKEGAKLTIHGRDPEGMKETHEKLNAEGVQDDRILEVYGDVVEEKTLRELVDKTVERYGGIDIVVNNAASSAGQAGLDTADIESLDYIFDQNVKSYMKLVHFAMPYLEKSKGNIVNVSSVDGVRPHPEAINYSVSKAAVDHYCRNASVTFAKKGVRINNLNPGYIHTEIKMREPDMDEKKLKE